VPEVQNQIEIKRRPVGTAETLRSIFAIREIGIFIALVALSAYIYSQNSSFLGAYNIRTILTNLSYFGLLAIGETLVILVGGIDLSVGSIVALAGFLTALGVKSGMPMGEAIFLTLILSALIGYIHGLFVTKLGVAPFIITLGTMIIARGVTSLITHGARVSGLPDSFGRLANDCIGPIPIPAIILFFFSVAAILLMQRTVLGRNIYSVGGNIEATRLAGVNVDRIRIFCYMACTLLAGLAGVIVASMNTSGDPAVGGGYELVAIAAVVIGGTSLMGGEGTMLGALLGTALMAVMASGLDFLRVDSFWQDICRGSVVVIAVTLDGLRRRRKRSSGVKAT
jgi:ribose transport system permease protein